MVGLAGAVCDNNPVGVDTAALPDSLAEAAEADAGGILEVCGVGIGVLVESLAERLGWVPVGAATDHVHHVTVGGGRVLDDAVELRRLVVHARR